MIEMPLLLAFLVLSAFTVGLTTLSKKLAKKCLPKFYKTKLYEIIKIIIPVIFCFIISMLTPDFIFSLVGISGINFVSKLWFGMFSGLLSGFGFQVFKQILKNISNFNKPKSDYEETA